MDKLAAMHTYVTIHERGSLTAAAEALGKSLPTVVRTLAELERQLGVVLLRRTTRRMSLTDEGRVYLERCRGILADVAEADELVATGRGEPRGQLRVTAPVLFGQMHVAPAIVDFVAEHTQGRVDLLLLDRVVNLVDEGIDVAVRIGSLADSSSIATTVGLMRRVVVASPATLRAQGKPHHPRDLTDRECVWFSGVGGQSWRFREGSKSLTVPVGGRLGFNQASAAVNACVAGAGFGMFLAYQVAPAVKAKKLRIVLEDYEQAPSPVSLVYSEARLLSPRTRALLDWMKPRLAAVLEP